MHFIANFITATDAYLSSHPLFIALLIGTGLFFTIYLKFPQIRYFKHAIKVARGRFDNEQSDGDASHFQALTTALSGTVGTGNIAGVALAIHLGGPAALFWMMITAAIGMSTKFVEVTLSHKYREKLPDGTMAGGPMYYMQKRLNIKLNKRTINTGKWLAIAFSVFTLIGAFGTGCLPQINSIASSMRNAFNLPEMLVGAVLACLLAVVVLGGIRRIVQVTEKLVPFMGIAYFIGALVVIIYHIDNLIPGICSIFTDAFTGSAVSGGFLGASVSFALTKGVARGLFSNEAGQGSAPIAHAAARCTEPAAEGLVALLEPFIDTIIICMLTGTMIVSSGVWKQKFENTFQQTDLLVLNGNFSDTEQTAEVLRNGTNLFNGNIVVENGQISTPNVTFIHAQSVAENVNALLRNKPYTGEITVKNGKAHLRTTEGEIIKLRGKSLVHSAALTIRAFASSWFGKAGEFIVALSLLLFAFSTSIAWCYYGDRAASFIFGTKAITPFRLLYVAGFFVGSFTDTTIVWSIASIGIVLMSVPNLIGLLILHREMKNEIDTYERKMIRKIHE
ncbi:MAG: sodium:alanine symporter family protein [Salinivirgaceae bacterium]|nr:sodium:alanine symporter family protein [Salinivirgaceae bacterium]